MAMSSYDATDPTEPFRQAPRSAVGLDSAAHTMFLVAVDGDQQGSLGMTAAELAGFLSGLGVSDALELDGGGSTTLYVRKEGGVVSSPSDGVERPVANQIGVHYGASTVRASVVGQVFDSKFNGTMLTTASVYVDDVLATWQNNHTLYHVDNVAPHYVCAKASAPGFKTGTQCRQITAADIQQSQIQYLSLVLFPGTDPPPDMARPPDMATNRPPMPTADLSVPTNVGDAGSGNMSHGGCALGGAPGSAATGLLAAIVLLLGAARIFRRRA
jgi:hypothetical protein